MDAGELALINNRDNMFDGGGAFFWVFALLLLSGGGFGMGGRGPMPDVATKEFVQDAVNNQAIQNGIRDVMLSSADNNYQTAQLINNLSNLLLSQSSQISQKLDQISYHMDQCCCEIKTQNLQNRLDDAQAALVASQNQISNANQTQYILSQLGRFVAWTPSGTQAASTAG